MACAVDNAIIMAAGTASRFAPLSYERPKALIEVRGEVLIERQIRQLREAGVPEIVVVTGHGGEQFAYLADKFGVILVENREYLTRNNNGSIQAARRWLKNSYVCSSDNYFSENLFESEVEDSYYAAVYAHGETPEWCITADGCGYINSVRVGGRDAWYMLGHTFWSEDFSRRFLDILDGIYHRPETAGLLWESIYMEHLDTLKMKLRQYPDGVIFEFDTLDELRLFDPTYVEDTRSVILKSIARELGCSEGAITEVTAFRGADNAAAGIRFRVGNGQYEYAYGNKKVRRI